MLMFLESDIGIFGMMGFGLTIVVCLVVVMKNMARGKQRRSAQRRESGLGDSNIFENQINFAFFLLFFFAFVVILGCLISMYDIAGALETWMRVLMWHCACLSHVPERCPILICSCKNTKVCV